MTATNRYLDRLASQLDGASDYRLAKELGIMPSAVYRYRAGEGQFDIRAAWRCAELLGIDAKEIIAAVELERAKSDKERAFWQRASTVAASILLAGLTGLQPAPTNASQRSAAVTENIHYAVRRRFGACPA